MTSLPRSGSQSNAQGGADTSGPQSCYPAEIETLREMLREERERLDVSERGIAEGRAIAGYLWNKDQAGRRIEALRTAIEALGGAL